MKFDGLRFTEDYNIPYTEKGKSVSRSFIGVRCPFCADQGFHLGIHKTKGYSTCWHCGFHRIEETIKALTGDNPYEVKKRYSTLIYSSDRDDYTPTSRPVKIEVPGRKEFNKLHYTYLKERGFDAEYVLHKYDVSATYFNDKYPHRLVFPVKYGGRVVSWQGRTLINSVPKYMTCPPEYEVMFHKDLFFNIDNAKNDSVLVVEGVFDAIRFGDNSVCSFGTSITDSQLKLLRNKYKRVFFLYDSEKEAQEKAKKALTSLNSCGIITEQIILGTGGDPGDLTDEEAIYIKSDLGIM